MRVFGRSRRDEQVLGLLDQSGGNVRRAGGALHEMLSDFPERADLARELLLCEQHGDRIAHDIIHLIATNGRHLPYDARDVYELVGALDDIVDYAEQAADSLTLYGVEAPMQQAEQLAEVLSRATVAVEAALVTLHQGGELNAHLVQIHELENEGDRVSRDAVASLFANGVDPMVVIRWKDIFEQLEQAIDSCETAAHVLEGIALKQRA